MYPLVVGAEPDVLARLDDRAVAGAGLAGRVQLVVAEVGSGPGPGETPGIFLRAAEILQQTLLDFVASEVWRVVTLGLLRV